MQRVEGVSAALLYGWRLSTRQLEYQSLTAEEEAPQQEKNYYRRESEVPAERKPDESPGEAEGEIIGTGREIGGMTLT